MAQSRAQKAAAKAKEKASQRAAEGGTESPIAAGAAGGVTAPAIDKSKKVAGAAQSTVFVVSRVTRGLYLQLFTIVEQKVRVMGGGMDVQKMPMRLPEKVRIKPTTLGHGLIPNYPIVDGWSITEGVPSDFWRKWLEQNPELDIVKSGMIAAFDSEVDARRYAKDRPFMRTGLEPLAQEKDPRVATSNHANVGDIDIDSETPRPKQ